MGSNNAKHVFLFMLFTSARLVHLLATFVAHDSMLEPKGTNGVGINCLHSQMLLPGAMLVTGIVGRLQRKSPLHSGGQSHQHLSASYTALPPFWHCMRRLVL